MKKLLFILLILLAACNSQKHAQREEVVYAEEMRFRQVFDIVAYEYGEELAMMESESHSVGAAAPVYEESEIIHIEPKERIVYSEEFQIIEEPSDNIGTITYNVPDTMKVGIHYKVSLRISRETFDTLILIGINRNPTINSTTTVDNVQVSNVMDAILIATDNDFTIDTTLSSKRQKIDGKFNEWIWDVVPNKKGYNNLRLVVKIVYINEGGFVKDLTVFEKDIYTKPNLKQAIKNWLPRWDWNWLWTSIIVPVFLFFWNKRKKKKEESKTPQDS